MQDQALVRGEIAGQHCRQEHSSVEPGVCSMGTYNLGVVSDPIVGCIKLKPV